MALYVHKYGGIVDGLDRAHPQRRQARRQVGAGRAPDGGGSFGDERRNEPARFALAKELSPEKSTPEVARELDMIAATGEQVSVGLLAIALQAEGLAAVSYAGWQVPIRTDSAYTKARIESIDATRACAADLAAGKVVVITGFQGIDGEGHVTTLGRGGSDTRRSPSPRR